MISYRRADLADRIREQNRPSAIDVVKSIFRWTTRFLNPNGPADDMDWDSTRCRCENNGDYCDYCEEVYQIQNNRPKTISKSALWNILENADRSTGLWRYLKKNMPPSELAELEHAMDSPVLAKLLHGMVFFEPDTKNIRESSISYRHADLLNRLNEWNTPQNIEFIFKNIWGEKESTVFEGGVYEAATDSDWPQTVLNMAKTVENLIHNHEKYKNGSYGESIVVGYGPLELAEECAERVQREPQYISHSIKYDQHNHEAILEVQVKTKI